jgi:hypothetical protein
MIVNYTPPGDRAKGLPETTDPSKTADGANWRTWVKVAGVDDMEMGFACRDPACSVCPLASTWSSGCGRAGDPRLFRTATRADKLLSE